MALNHYCFGNLLQVSLLLWLDYCVRRKIIIFLDRVFFHLGNDHCVNGGSQSIWNTFALILRVLLFFWVKGKVTSIFDLNKDCVNGRLSDSQSALLRILEN